MWRHHPLKRIRTRKSIQSINFFLLYLHCSSFRDETISGLQQGLEVEKEMKEQLVREAHSRIEQYENRLLQMKSEIDLYKKTSEERLEQLQTANGASIQNFYIKNKLTKTEQASFIKFIHQGSRHPQCL